MFPQLRIIPRHFAYGGLGVTAALAGFLILARGPWSPVSAQQPSEPEISTQEKQPEFTVRARTNEVLVRAVVRDAQGQAVPNLTKEDFRLFDNGKPQVIREFSVELSRPAAPSAAEQIQPSQAQRPSEQVESAPPAIAERFVAFYFDDTFMSFEDIVRTREAALRYLKASLTPGDRAGLFTSSQQVEVEFTSDRAKLEDGLARLRPHPSASDQGGSECLSFSPYEAYLIAEQEESHPVQTVTGSVQGPSGALEIAVQKVIHCVCAPQNVNLPSAAGGGTIPITGCPSDPTLYATSRARNDWERFQIGMLQSLRGLDELVRRLSAMPGERSIVWVSAGFLAVDRGYELSSVIDHALRARVVINALDSRGLWTLIPGGDAAQRDTFLNGRAAALENQLAQTAQRIDGDVMAAAASGTGGVFFHDSNDYDGGFRRVGALPEAAYLLTFTPLDLKYDGKYHILKVELVSARGLSLQARKGYFAPKEAYNSVRQAKDEIEDEVYAREERKDLPLEIHTQFFMSSRTEAQLSVVAWLDLHGVRLHKEQQRNVGELRFVTALFDQDGNLVEGKERVCNLRLQDATLKGILVGGFATRWRFTVKPGTYVVREVVRDGGSGNLAALSRTVEIPFSN